jgi:predicted transcriptional regulator
MRIKDLVYKYDFKIFAGEKGLDREVKGGYVSDLLSDVMGNAEKDQLWLTLQTHKNVMAIASLKDLAGVLLVNGNEPEPDMLEMANEESIPVLGSSQSTFETTGKIYEFLNR